MSELFHCFQIIILSVYLASSIIFLLISSNHLAFAQIPGIINTPSSSPKSDQQQQNSTNDNLGQEQNQVDSFAAGFLNVCNSTNTIDESLSTFENTASLAKHSHAYQQGYYNAINNIKLCNDKKVVASYLKTMQAHYVKPLVINRGSLLSVVIPEVHNLPPFSTYENSQYGFKIEYPSDWKQREQLVTPPMLETNSRSPSYVNNDAVTLFTGNRSSLAIVRIIPISTSLNYSNTYTDRFTANKNKTPHDYVLDYIMEKHDVEKEKKNMPVTVGVNHYPAWRLDYTSTVEGFGQKNNFYNIIIYTVLDDRVFKFNFECDALLTSTYLPIFQKMIDSFQLNS